MEISTTRFGIVTIDDGDVLTFAQGLIGMEDCQRWALLADAENSALGWLQSVDRPHVALAVVSPRRFVPDYRVRVSRREIDPLGISRPGDAQVLVIVNQSSAGLTLNLKAPLVVYLQNRMGRQVIAKDDHAVGYVVPGTSPLRKTA